MLVLQVVTIDELKEDDVYEEIYDDMKDECGKYGELPFLFTSKHRTSLPVSSMKDIVSYCVCLIRNPCKHSHS